MFGLELGNKRGFFLIPQTAVLTSDLGKAVYLVNEKNEAIIQPVVTGKWIGKSWVVTEGLKAGDKVIVDNLIKLRPGILVSPHSVDMSQESPLKQTDSVGKK